MRTEINVSKYEHVKEIYWGAYYTSSYKHNYYYSNELKDVIDEEYDSDGYLLYWRINGYSRHYLGASECSIFEEKTGTITLTDDY